MFGPFEPSPGYGPPVSSGIGSVATPVAVEPVVAPVVVAVVDSVAALDGDAAEPDDDAAVPDEDGDEDAESVPHAARKAAAPRPARAVRAVRRLNG